MSGSIKKGKIIMESNVKIKCTQEEIDDLFDNDDFICVKLYEKISDNLYNCILRHKELEEKLHGTYTIQRLKELLY